MGNGHLSRKARHINKYSKHTGGVEYILHGNDFIKVLKSSLAAVLGKQPTSYIQESMILNVLHSCQVPESGMQSRYNPYQITGVTSEKKLTPLAFYVTVFKP
jgi:hypothetical protein